MKQESGASAQAEIPITPFSIRMTFDSGQSMALAPCSWVRLSAVGYLAALT